MRRTHGLVAVVLAVGVAMSGCYGPFRLTRKLHQWNGQVGGKWANEAVFVFLAWVPVYAVAAAADAIVFNAIEFWGGRSPVSQTPVTKRIVRGSAQVMLTRLNGPAGPELLVEQWTFGRPAGTLHVRQQDGITVGADAAGVTLLTAETLPDGSVVVRDGQGCQAARHTAGEVQRLAAARQ